MSLRKKIVLFMAVLLVIPIYLNQNMAVANAAAPSFTKKVVVIQGVGNTNQLKIRNTVKGSKYKWSSTDRTIATVTSKGLVTSVNKGTVVIKCKIIYPSKKSLTITCNVSITIPAEGIIINNANNGSYKLLVGQSFKFTCEMTPSTTTDNVYWTIGKGDKDCIKVDETGNVTGLKAGKVILNANAASSATVKSTVSDEVIIEVVNPSANVTKAEIINSNELKIEFDSPVDASTVIGSNGKLLDNISLSLKKNDKNVLASDPGLLTASLSNDLKTLTISSANMFLGNYGITITSKVKTTNGVSIDECNKELSYVDTIGPSIVSIDLDDSGLINVIKFTEPIDIKNLKAQGAAIVANNAGNTYTASTLTTINNKLNYVLSTDKKSLSINLSKIVATDYGKTFSVILSGITDLAGNSPANFTLSVYLRTDNTPKEQAVPLSITRTSNTTLTATFNRAIQLPGYITINGTVVVGVVDVNDNKNVNYTLPPTLSTLNGIQNVLIGYWSGYNVRSTDNSAQQMRTFTVNFTADTTNPMLLTYDFDAEKSILTLTFNKTVTLASISNIFSTTLKTVTDDIVSGTNINYTKIASTDNRVIKLQLSNMKVLGSYTFNLDAGFVVDNYNNKSLVKSITISNASGSSSELPGPISIKQSTTNLSQINLDFANKIDVASAQNISNYKIPGVTVISAVVTKNTTEGATVLLTVADGSIDVTLERPITITGVMGYSGSYTAIKSFTKTVLLYENKKPNLVNTTFDITKKRICLNFSKDILGTMSVNVTQLGSNLTYTNTVSVSGSVVYITLDNVPMSGTYLKIDILSNGITDLSGNAPTIPTSINALVMY